MAKRKHRALFMQFNIELGARIQAMRLKRGLTQVELAELFHLGLATIATIEIGRQGVDSLDLVRIAMALGVRPTTLLPKLPLARGRK